MLSVYLYLWILAGQYMKAAASQVSCAVFKSQTQQVYYTIIIIIISIITHLISVYANQLENMCVHVRGSRKQIANSTWLQKILWSVLVLLFFIWSYLLLFFLSTTCCRYENCCPWKKDKNCKAEKLTGCHRIFWIILFLVKRYHHKHYAFIIHFQCCFSSKHRQYNTHSLNVEI